MTMEIIRLSFDVKLHVNQGLLNNSITDYEFRGKNEWEVENIHDWSLKCLTNSIQETLSYYDQNYSIDIGGLEKLTFSKKKNC